MPERLPTPSPLPGNAHQLTASAGRVLLSWIESSSKAPQTTVTFVDGWTINGCPVNGPAVAANGRDVAVAWFTASTGDGRAFVAFSHDSGRSFGEPIRVDDDGTRGHVDVELLPDGSAAVSYTDATGARPQFRVRPIEARGARSPGITVADVAGSDYPRLAQGRDELLFAWTDTENGFSRVRTARAALLSIAPR